MMSSRNKRTRPYKSYKLHAGRKLLRKQSFFLKNWLKMPRVSPEVLSLQLQLRRLEFNCFLDEAVNVHPRELILGNGKV